MKDLNAREKLKQNKRQGQMALAKYLTWLWDRANRLREKRREDKRKEEKKRRRRRKKEEEKEKEKQRYGNYSMNLYGFV